MTSRRRVNRSSGIRAQGIPKDPVDTPVNSKARANRRGSPTLAATVLITNLVAGRGRGRAHALAPSAKVVAIVVHDLGPCGREVTRELLLRVVLCVDLGDG